MSFKRIAIVAVTLALSAAVWAEQMPTVRQPEVVPAGKVLALADCIDLALKNQPLIRQAAAQVQSSAGQVSQARSRLLPNATISSSVGIDGSVRNGTSINLGASQLIYDFGRSQSQVTTAEHQRSASELDVTRSRADVILNVKQSYYDLLQASHLVEVFTENVKSQDEHVKQAQAFLDAGTAPRADLLKAQAAAASARVDLITAQNNADQARVVLNSAMGIDVHNPLQIAEAAEPDTPVPDEDQALKLALDRRPEIGRDRQDVLAAQSGVKTARTGNAPAIVSTLSQSNSTGGQFGSSNSWQVGLGLQWSPIDTGSVSGAVKQAQAQVTSAQEAMYSDRQSIASEVTQFRLNVLAATAQLAAAEAEVASAQENLAAATGRYQASVGILLDVLDAQAALLKAQVDEYSARYGLSIARAGLEHAIGGSAVVTTSSQGGR